MGRREELEALEVAARVAKDGLGSVVLVAGEAGMGKSRLLSEFAIRVGDEITVAVGECLPLAEGELPYAPVVTALRSLARDASEADALVGPSPDTAVRVPELSLPDDGGHGPLSGDASQGQLFERLLALFVDAARARPLAIVVEDFQWADRSTQDFLAFLVRATRREPIAVIISYRSDELRRGHSLRPFVLELERSGRATTIVLGPFSRAELQEQVAAILDQPSATGVIDDLFARSEGNPFFTEELLVASRRADETLSDSLRDTLLARVESHRGDVREVLRTAAVAGRTVDHSLLAAATELPEEGLNEALRQAVEDYLLAPDASAAGYSFRHALLREAIYFDLLPGERQSLHLRLARLLASQSGEAPVPAGTAAEVAHHFYAAGELPAALAASLGAAIAAERLPALCEAWLHYQRALEIWDLAVPTPDDLPLDRLEVMRRAADAALLTGETEPAIELARAVLEAIDERHQPVQAALAHERLGRYLWTAGRGEAALPEYARAVELMPVEPSASRALVLAAEAQVLMLDNRTSESSVRCEEALAIARAVGAEGVEAHVLNTICGNLTAIGDFDGAFKAATRALKIARRGGHSEEIGRSYTNGSDALEKAGRIEESIAMAFDGIESAKRLGIDRNCDDFLRGEVAGRLLLRARWNEAEQLLGDVIDRGPTGLNAAMVYGHLGQLQTERGQFADASAALDQADDQIRGSWVAMWLGPPCAARASLELWQGRPEAAASVIVACLQRVTRDEYAVYTARLYQHGVRAYADLSATALGDRRAVQRLTTKAHALLERLDGLIARHECDVSPFVAACRAGCEAELSRIGEAGEAARWADVVVRWEALGNRYDAAYARWRQAEALLAAGGDRGEIEALLRTAHEVAIELRAKPLQDELEALARRARFGLGQERSGTSEPADLTPREVEVLALLADGMTNREIAAELFISSKTVSVHVSRILAKLEVPNRAAAATAAYSLGVKRSRAPSRV